MLILKLYSIFKTIFLLTIERKTNVIYVAKSMVHYLREQNKYFASEYFVILYLYIIILS